MKISNVVPLEITHVSESLSESYGRLIVLVKHHGVDLRLDATSLFFSFREFYNNKLIPRDQEGEE